MRRSRINTHHLAGSIALSHLAVFGLLMVMTHAVVTSPAQVIQGFPDVPPTHPYASAVEYMRVAGTIRGYPDGTFHPDDPVSRGELVKFLLGERSEEEKSSCLANIGSTPRFSDVDMQTAWFGPYLCIAAKENIVKGYDDGTYGPEKTVSAAEALKIVAGVYKLKPINDVGDYPWYAPFVEAMHEWDAIPQTLQTADQPVTRGEVAEMLYRLRPEAQQQPQDEGQRQIVRQHPPARHAGPDDESAGYIYAQPGAGQQTAKTDLSHLIRMSQGKIEIGVRNQKKPVKSEALKDYVGFGSSSSVSESGGNTGNSGSTGGGGGEQSSGGGDQTSSENSSAASSNAAVINTVARYPGICFGATIWAVQNPVSDDGRFALFMADFDTMVGNDNNQGGLFLVDLLTGNNAVRVSTTANAAVMTPEGRFVTYLGPYKEYANGRLQYCSGNTGNCGWVNNSQNPGPTSVFIYENSGADADGSSALQVGTSYHAAYGNPPNSGITCAHYGYSSNGQFIACDTYAALIPSLDKNGRMDVYIQNVQTKELRLVSMASNGYSAICSFDNGEPTGTQNGIAIDGGGAYRPHCGNGIHEQGERCDNGGQNSNTAAGGTCSASCLPR